MIKYDMQALRNYAKHWSDSIFANFEDENLTEEPLNPWVDYEDE